MKKTLLLVLLVSFSIFAGQTASILANKDIATLIEKLEKQAQKDKYIIDFRIENGEKVFNVCKGKGLDRSVSKDEVISFFRERSYEIAEGLPILNHFSPIIIAYRKAEVSLKELLPNTTYKRCSAAEYRGDDFYKFAQFISEDESVNILFSAANKEL